MPSVKNPCFKGRGQVAMVNYADMVAKIAGPMPVGNASMLAVNVSEKTEKVPDYTSSAGGTHCSSRELEGAEVQIELYAHSAENLVRSLYGHGSTDNVATAAVVDEPLVAWPGAITPLVDLPDLDVAIAVKSIDGLTTYVPGTDYLVTEGGSIIVLESGAIPDPAVVAGVGQANIEVSYTRRAQTLVQMLTKASEPVFLLFDGVNIMEGGTTTRFSLYKCKFGPAQKVDVVSDSASKLVLTGDIQRDETKPLGTAANPFSQYGTLRI
jgi:hypothetical protein